MSDESSGRLTRRRFLETSLAAAAPFMGPVRKPVSSAPKPHGPRLNVAAIGLGAQMQGHLREITTNLHQNLIAVCDVDDNRIAASTKANPAALAKARVYKDYRKLLETEKTSTRSSWPRRTTGTRLSAWQPCMPTSTSTAKNRWRTRSRIRDGFGSVAPAQGGDTDGQPRQRQREHAPKPRTDPGGNIRPNARGPRVASGAQVALRRRSAARRGSDSGRAGLGLLARPLSGPAL